MEAYEKLSQILRTDKDVIKGVSEKLSIIAGHNGVLEEIYSQNEAGMKRVFHDLAIPAKSAREIFLFLVSKIKKDDEKLADVINSGSSDDRAGFENILKFARETTGVNRGIFLKLDKAKEFIIKNPPEKIIKFLKYKGAEELVEKENIFEIFAALRFMEGMDWMNNTFLKEYKSLTPDDFEERDVTAIVLDDKWREAAVSFTKKKYHNLSHSKEMGIIFVIPIKIDLAGATFMDFSLALHYFHEVDFYSKLFKKYKDDTVGIFSDKLMSALRGDVIDVRPPEGSLGKEWLIIQRYLAKDDQHDWRLFYPHISPEALHWTKVERDIARFSREKNLGIEFWEGLGFVGDFYQDEAGVEVLVSFNFLDTVMALFKEVEMVKYLYHHQEALWNRIFSGYLGEENMEQLIIDNFYKGKMFL